MVTTPPASQETQVQSLVQKTPHALKQRALCTTTIEPVLESLGATTTESSDSTAHACNEESVAPAHCS